MGIRGLALSTCFFIGEESSLSPPRYINCYWRLTAESNPAMDRHCVQMTFITQRPFWSPWGIEALSLHCLCPSSLTLNERLDGQSSVCTLSDMVLLLHATETRISSPSGTRTNYLAVLIITFEFSSYLCSFCHHQYIQQSIRTSRIRRGWCKQRLHDNRCCLRCIHPNL